MKIFRIATELTLDYRKVESLLMKIFNSNSKNWAETWDEIGYTVEWDGKSEYKLRGPFMGQAKEVIVPDSEPGWIIVGFLHNHTEGEEAELSDFDISEAETHISKTQIPLCMAVIGLDPMGSEQILVNFDWFEP